MHTSKTFLFSKIARESQIQQQNCKLWRSINSNGNDKNKDNEKNNDNDNDNDSDNDNDNDNDNNNDNYNGNKIEYFKI